jgi:catechol 2,3-dioxygenase-like lactoylglutathione lyase family enzyme
MLESQELVAFVGTRDPVRAKHFYRDTLGLHLVSEDELALVFDASGTMLRVTRVQELAAAKYTYWAGGSMTSFRRQDSSRRCTLPWNAIRNAARRTRHLELAERREGSLVQRPRWKHVEHHAVLNLLDSPP